MHVIALAQQKGGVGKSTLAIHLAAEAQRLGQQSVIIELDRQGTASTLWAAARSTAGLGKPDVLRQDANKLEQTLHVMRGLGVKVVVLDLPGSANPAINTAIKLADLVLLPTRPQEVDIAASGDALAIVQRLRKRYGYVLTFVEGKGGRAEEAKSSLEAEGHYVAPQFVHRRQEYVDAIVTGRVAAELRSKGKESKAAEEVAALWKWISAELEKGGHEQHVEHERVGGRSRSAA